MSRPRVALLIETSQIYGREIYSGIADYVETHTGWSIFLDQRELGAAPPKWLTQKHWGGLMSRVTTPALVRTIRKMGVAAVDLTDRGPNLGLPRIVSDHESIGKLAAEHLLARGFRHFAFCGYKAEAWSAGRLTGFRNRLAAEKLPCIVDETEWTTPQALPWDAEEERLARWLRQCDRPVGIMACNDYRGQQVLESCRRAELNVPEQVAVVGVDDDRVLCRLSDPPLSSVVPNARKIGFDAAALLDEMMRGRKVDPDDLKVPPIRVVARRSSDTYAVDQPELASALRHIQQNACEGLTVQGVLEHVGMSRSMLERMFRLQLGKTPHAFIREVQRERAIELVSESSLPMKEVAQRCGLRYVEYLNYLFKRWTGLSPGEYRRIHSRGTLR